MVIYRGRKKLLFIGLFEVVLIKDLRLSRSWFSKESLGSGRKIHHKYLYAFHGFVCETTNYVPELIEQKILIISNHFHFFKINLEQMISK